MIIPKNLKLGDKISVKNYDKLLNLKASITRIEGRDNDYLILRDGSKLSGSTFYAALEYFSFVRQFRIIQTQFGKCEILISLLDCNNNNKKIINNRINEILTNKISYEIHFVNKIPMDPNGKTKILISRI